MSQGLTTTNSTAISVAILVTVLTHTSAYVSIRQNTSAYASIRQQQSASPSSSSSQSSSISDAAPSSLCVSICTIVLVRRAASVFVLLY